MLHGAGKLNVPGGVDPDFLGEGGQALSPVEGLQHGDIVARPTVGHEVVGLFHVGKSILRVSLEYGPPPSPHSESISSSMPVSSTSSSVRSGRPSSSIRQEKNHRGDFLATSHRTAPTSMIRSVLMIDALVQEVHMNPLQVDAQEILSSHGLLPLPQRFRGALSPQREVLAMGFVGDL